MLDTLKLVLEQSKITSRISGEPFIVFGILIILGIILGKVTSHIGKTSGAIFTVLFFLLAGIILLMYTGIL